MELIFLSIMSCVMILENELLISVSFMPSNLKCFSFYLISDYQTIFAERNKKCYLNVP